MKSLSKRANEVKIIARSVVINILPQSPAPTAQFTVFHGFDDEALAGQGLRFALYVHHTDGDREWAYDRKSSIGRLDKGFVEAKKKGWTIVDMKRDWKVIYPHEMR